MLTDLVIRDLALIERVELSFVAGLNVITGETGAGKSLLVGALELMMGERAKPGIVRKGARRAEIEGRFRLSPGPATEPVVRWLRNHLPLVVEDWEGLGEGEERGLTLGRTVGEDGKTRAFVNQRAVTIKVLRELALRLFEIHGQNDHQKLLDPSEQLILLDDFGGLEGVLKDYRKARAKWFKLVEEALALREEQQERRDRLDLARFQLAEIEHAGPEPDERLRLAPEREVLRNAEGLKRGLSDVMGELFDADPALADRLRRAAQFVEQWKDRIAALGPVAEELDAACMHLEEAGLGLRSFTEAVEVDPARLEAVEERLAELERLEHKYGCPAAGLLALAAELRAEIEQLEVREQSLEDLGPALEEVRAQLLACGGALRRKRKAVRAKLVKSVQATLVGLGLENAEFDVRLGQRGEESGIERVPEVMGLDQAALEADRLRFGERGMDRIEFLLAANTGESKSKLRQVASGGETARIMLALRTVLARSKHGPGRERALIFDEIDSGVGGRLGPAVGEHLRKLGRFHQVLCVTHLPAIAAVATQHLRVQKEVAGGRTLTRVELLDGERRVEEVADMIAGGGDEATARAEARRLIGKD